MRPFVAGAILFAVAMGVGRFAYTPLLVLMRADAGLTVPFAGVLASANLAGYLAGALLAMLPALQRRRSAIVLGSAYGVAALTALMAAPSATWLFARTLTGVLSGLVFVLTVSIMLEHASAVRSRWGPAVFFGGVGAGIALVGVLVPPLARLGGSRGTWLALGVASALAVFAASRMLPRADRPAASAATRGDAPPSRAFWLLAALYGLEGAVYIIPATFLVAMIAEVPAIVALAPYAWVLVGVTAAPSVLAWSAIAARAGSETALIVAGVVQGVALLAPLILPAPLAAIVLALGLGATFIGMTALGTALGRAYWPARATAAVGVLTVLYGIGQIVGPLFATHVALVTGSYRAALPMAAVAVLAPTAVFALARRALLDTRAPRTT